MQEHTEFSFTDEVLSFHVEWCSQIQGHIIFSGVYVKYRTCHNLSPQLFVFHDLPQLFT